MSMPKSWVENCTEKCGVHLNSVWMYITTPLRRTMTTLYGIPFTHPQLLFQFFQFVNYKHNWGGGGISHGVGQGHILRSRNLRCWKQRTQMPRRVVRSLIHSS
jgi:hypothetical protein